jgi:hypothetical protein
VEGKLVDLSLVPRVHLLHICLRHCVLRRLELLLLPRLRWLVIIVLSIVVVVVILLAAAIVSVCRLLLVLLLLWGLKFVVSLLYYLLLSKLARLVGLVHLLLRWGVGGAGLSIRVQSIFEGSRAARASRFVS